MQWTSLITRRPSEYRIVILTDGKDIFHDMLWLDEFISKHDNKVYPSGWYHVNGYAPLYKDFTHWLVLELP